MDMINLLEKKYHRKVAGGTEDIGEAIKETVNSKFIRPRGNK